MNGDYDSDDFESINTHTQKKKKKERNFLIVVVNFIFLFVLGARIFHLNGYSFSL